MATRMHVSHIFLSVPVSTQGGPIFVLVFFHSISAIFVRFWQALYQNEHWFSSFLLRPPAISETPIGSKSPNKPRIVNFFHCSNKRIAQSVTYAFHYRRLAIVQWNQCKKEIFIDYPRAQRVYKQNALAAICCFLRFFHHNFYLCLLLLWLCLQLMAGPLVVTNFLISLSSFSILLCSHLSLLVNAKCEWWIIIINVLALMQMYHRFMCSTRVWRWRWRRSDSTIDAWHSPTISALALSTAAKDDETIFHSIFNE